MSNVVVSNTGVRNQKVSNLIVSKATPLDGGVYTCQVVDWGIQQCASIRLHVITAPHVTVEPRSLTVQKVSVKRLEGYIEILEYESKSVGI